MNFKNINEYKKSSIKIQNKLDKEIKEYTDNINIDPDNEENYNSRGICYDEKGLYEKAIEDYTKAIELYSEYDEAYNNRGLAYENLGEYEKAIKDYSKAIEINSEEADVYYNRGISYENLGKYEKAKEDFSKAIELNPEEGEYFYNRALCYEALNDNEKAIEDYTQVIKLDSANDEAYNNRGICYSNIGDYLKAIEDYSIVIKLNSENAEVYYNRALCYEKKDRYIEAIEDYEKAIKLYPDDEEAKKKLGECLKKINEYHAPENMIELISTKKVWHSRTVNFKYTVACIDCGLKKSLVKMLNDLGCNVVVLPYNASIDTILKYKPNGLFISDGPGSPYNVSIVVETINKLKGSMPILGVGLGQELIGLSYGAKIFKQKAGHNGCNLPVRNLKTNKIEITNQNDQYALDINSLKDTDLVLTHTNLLDDIPEGIEDLKNSVLAVQYNPIADYDNPEFIFNRFIALMKEFGGKKNA